MPDAAGRFRGISVPELPWLRSTDEPAPGLLEQFAGATWDQWIRTLAGALDGLHCQCAPHDECFYDQHPEADGVVCRRAGGA